MAGCRMRKRKRRKLIIWLLLLPAVVYLLAVTVYPFVFTVFASFTDWYLLENTRSFTGVANFVSLLKDQWFWPSLRITLVFTGACLLGEHFLGLALALLLSLTRKVKEWLPLVFMIPMMLPPIVTALIWKLIYRPLGVANWVLEKVGIRPLEWILNSSQVVPSLIMVDLWQWTPFVMLILFSGIVSIPNELFDAADIDGGSLWARVRFVLLPLLTPLLTVSVMLRFIYLFTTFDIIAGLTRGGPGQASMTLYYYSYLKAFEWFRLGEAGTLNLLIFAITMVTGTLLLNKVFREVGGFYD